MTTDSLATAESLPSPTKTPHKRRNGWYRAFWRWHFYASFLVIPVLLMLTVTGLVYLFRFQIEPALHPQLMTLDPPAGAVPQPYTTQHAAVADAFPNATIMSMTEPSDPDHSAVFSLSMPNGTPRDAYVNPWTGDVLGSLNPDQTVSGIAVRLHAELMMAPWGDYLIELAACWAIVMALTGYVLFFKGRAARTRRKGDGVTGASLRHRHATVGSVVGLGLLLLLVSGLPWTGFWGGTAQQMATANGSSLWSQDPGAVSKPASTLDESLPHSHRHEVPWGLGKSGVPGADDDRDADQAVASLDTAIAVADKHGLRHPMTVTLPESSQGVFSVISYAFNNPSDERTVHVDRYDGQVVASYGYNNYPALAKTVSQGIALHEGRRFGTANMWVTTAFCLMVIFMCLTGPLMWWRRRPRRHGAVGAPRGRLPIKATPALAAGLLALGTVLPMFGASLIVVLLVDQLLLRRVPALARWLNVT
ncbi:MAG: PepSY-associated TM helix domain-containing protein [Pseudonocardiaceae bacterium]